MCSIPASSATCWGVTPQAQKTGNVIRLQAYRVAPVTRIEVVDSESRRVADGDGSTVRLGVSISDANYAGCSSPQERKAPGRDGSAVGDGLVVAEVLV